jgi:hypothetical protein
MVEKAVTAIAVVLFWTSLASAECAWVLWGTVGVEDPKIPDITTPWNAFDTKAACEVEQQKNLQGVASVAAKAQAQVLTAEGTVFIKQPGKPLTIHTYRCLPDTIDPRKPR